MNEMKYTGFGDSPEEACKDLERQLQRDVTSHAFVTISEPNLTRKLSPRGLNRYAIANVLDGKDYRVKFSRGPIGKIQASIELRFVRTESEDELIFSPRGSRK